MSTALIAGVSGLSANAARLASISDNIANSGTHGYKRVETDFDSLVLNQGRTAGLYSAGGVRSSTARIIDQQGGLATTSNPLDLAISGRGMLPVTSAVDLDNGFTDFPLMMTRTGAFRPDAAGILRTDSGLVLLGWPAQSDGTIPLMPRDAIGGLEPVQISVNQSAGDPTRNIKLGVNLPAHETRAGSSGAPYDLKIEYYGNLGTSDSLDVTFTPQVSATPGMSNTWTMQIRDSVMDPASNVVANIEIVFDNTAALGGSISAVNGLGAGSYDPATGLLTFNVQGGPMTVDMGRLGAQTGLRQLASSFSPTNITKDGSPVGNLTSVEVDENGLVRATYDTGFIKTLYQVPMIDVANPNGLISFDHQAFGVSPTSGSFFLWDAGDGPTGSIVGYAREESTTDVASELTDLIVTQRAYSSNAKVIQTVDEMLQETTNIKR